MLQFKGPDIAHAASLSHPNGLLRYLNRSEPLAQKNCAFSCCNKSNCLLCCCCCCVRRIKESAECFRDPKTGCQGKAGSVFVLKWSEQVYKNKRKGEHRNKAEIMSNNNNTEAPHTFVLLHHSEVAAVQLDIRDPPSHFHLNPIRLNSAGCERDEVSLQVEAKKTNPASS